MIQFTQYLRPNGRKIPTTITRSPEIEKKAQELIENGFHFDIEKLNTGEVSMTCENDHQVLAARIVPDGPEIPDAVDQMITSAYIALMS